MKTIVSARRLRHVGALFMLLLLVAACKKEEEKNPLLSCRPAGGGNGIGIANARTIMFWMAQDFGCGQPYLVSIRNTETNMTNYGGLVNAFMTKFFKTQPACGTEGAITIQVSKGYEYEYTIACTGREWKAKLTADCSDDCIAIELK